jgi:hypothetical protein
VSNVATVRDRLSLSAFAILPRFIVQGTWLKPCGRRSGQGDPHDCQKDTVAERRGTRTLLLASAGCAEERDPVNRVAPNALHKAFFVGADLESDADNPEFDANGTLLDIGYGAGQYGMFTSFCANQLSIIRWEVTEDLLIGRLRADRGPCRRSPATQVALQPSPELRSSRTATRNPGQPEIGGSQKSGAARNPGQPEIGGSQKSGAARNPGQPEIRGSRDTRQPGRPPGHRDSSSQRQQAAGAARQPTRQPGQPDAESLPAAGARELRFAIRGWRGLRGLDGQRARAVFEPFLRVLGAPRTPCYLS